MKRIKNRLTSVLAFVAIPGAVYLLFLILRPVAFGKFSMLGMLITQSFINSIIAWGLSFSMTAGNLDLSIGAQISVSTIVGCLLSQKIGMPGLILGCVGTSLVVGVIKVLLMRVIRMSSMVISIAYALILASIGGVIGGSEILVISTEHTILGRFPANVIIFLTMGAIMFFLQKYSVYGAKARAVGGNPVLAESAGISTIQTQSVAIMLAAVYGGIAALLSLSYGTGTSIENGLDTIGTAFQAMLGVFVAGFISKQVNIVFGIFAGILSLNILQTGLVAVNFDTNLKNTITGLFLIILMAVTEMRKVSAEEKMHRDAFKANSMKRKQVQAADR